MNPRSPLLTVGALVTVLLLSGCTSGGLEDYPDVTAVLDAEAGTVTLPLDRYVATTREGFLVEHANAISVDDCMEKSGYDFPRAQDSWDTKYIPAERRYGLWNAAEAQTNGYETPTDPVTAHINRLEETYPQRWWDTVWACLDSIDRIPASVANSAEQQSPVDVGISEARGRAQNSEEWATARAEWVECLSKRGIPTSDDDLLTPTLPSDPSMQRKYAVADVACKKQVHFVQRLADVEAKYQAAYIDDHKSELEEFRLTVDQNLARARAIVASTVPPT